MSEKQNWIGMREEAHNPLCLPREVNWILCPNSP